MGKFIIGTFAILAWAFYVLSGGADFQPETRVVADAAPWAGDDTDRARAEAAALIAVAAPAAASEAQPEPAAPASLASTEPTTVATGPAISIQSAADAAAPVPASVQTAPAFDGETAAAGTLEPTFTSLSAPAPGTVGSPDLTAVREVSARAVNMREGPSTSYNVIDTLPQGTQAEIVDRDGTGWVRVRIVSTGQTGWMAERLLTNG